MTSDLVRAITDAFASNDREALGRTFADDIVMRGTIGGLDEQRVMQGREAVLDYFAEIVDPWERLDVEFDGVVEAPGTVVLLMREIGRTARTSLEVSRDTAMVLRVRDGRIYEMRGYLDRDAALAAAGVTAS